MGLSGYVLGRKRETPREILEKTKEVEHAYLKLPRRRLIDISLESSKNKVVLDTDKIEEILEKAGKDKYATIHTHPTGKREYVMAVPSHNDLEVFMKDKKSRTMFVAQQDEETGEIHGYFCLRKTKETRPYSGSTGDYIKAYKFAAGRYTMPTLKKICKLEHLKFRVMPAENFTFDKEKGLFVKRKSLEEKLIAVVIGLALASLLARTSTGNAILSLNNIPGNFIIALILAGILGVVCYLYIITTNK